MLEVDRQSLYGTNFSFRTSRREGALCGQKGRGEGEKQFDPHFQAPSMVGFSSCQDLFRSLVAPGRTSGRMFPVIQFYCTDGCNQAVNCEVHDVW